MSLVELLLVLSVTLIASGMAVPSLVSMRRSYRSLGDARDLHSMILLAKMRAAANFTRARVRFNLTGRSFQLEIWNRTTNVWNLEGGANSLSQGVNFGPGSLPTTSPPPLTQTTLGQAPACRPGTAGNPGGGSDITNTACIVFNSRGIPVNNAAAPYADNAIYISDTESVYGTTVSITGQSQAWRSSPTVASWNRR